MNSGTHFSEDAESSGLGLIQPLKTEYASIKAKHNTKVLLKLSEVKNKTIKEKIDLCEQIAASFNMVNSHVIPLDV